jgi:hypothetical protein
MPDLTNILIQVASGDLTPAEAEPLVKQATADRNTFAGAALTGYTGRGVNFASNEALAAKCWEQADAMVAAAAAGGAA